MLHYWIYNYFQSLSIIHQRNHRMLLTPALGTGETAIQVIDQGTPLKSSIRTMPMILQHAPSKSSRYFLKMPMLLQIILEYITLDSQATIPALLLQIRRIKIYNQHFHRMAIQSCT